MNYRTCQAVRLVMAGLALAVICCNAVIQPPNEYRKKLQGPPSGFDHHKIPSPALAALESDSMWREVAFTHDAARRKFVWKGEFPVDSQVELGFSIFCPHEQYLDVMFQPPGETAIMANNPEAFSRSFRKRTGPFGIDGATFPVTTYSFSKPALGIWSVELSIDAERISSVPLKAVIMVTNRNGWVLSSHLNKYEIEVGQELGVIGHVCPIQGLGQGCASSLYVGVLNAQMVINFPDGRKIEITMHDDGRHEDMEANDGVYGALFEALEPGHYTAQAIFVGTTSEDIRFERSAEHSFYVVEPYITLTGLADVELREEFFHFHLHVDAQDKRAVKAYAEVWGTDASGFEYAPVGWMQAIVDPERNSALTTQVITLQIHENWMHKARVTPPFQLRNVWIQDRRWNVVLSERNAIFVNSADIKFVPDPKLMSSTIEEKMLFGPRPLNMTRSARDNREKGTLILVHGYCSSENPFPLSDFDNAVHFEDFKQSRPTDDFALLLREFGQQFPAFSLVGHSHGGIASTHLHAYYWSNLENSQEGRLIQSVGTPYHGSALAGSLADLGRFFGLGCGKNNDLTYDAANKWAAAIPDSVAADVYYYTTQYKESLFSDYCVFGASLVLNSPNDGTAELAKSHLQGANNAGHKEGWCHTSGMNYPSQCQDPERNREMNAAAAR